MSSVPPPVPAANRPDTLLPRALQSDVPEELLTLLAQLPPGIHDALVSYCRVVLASHRRTQP